MKRMAYLNRSKLEVIYRETGLSPYNVLLCNQAKGKRNSGLLLLFWRYPVGNKNIVFKLIALHQGLQQQRLTS